jgi:hypothetical protein
MCYLYSQGIRIIQSNTSISTHRKVVGSIPDSVIGIFHWHNPSGRTVASNKNEYHEYFLGLKAAGT